MFFQVHTYFFHFSASLHSLLNNNTISMGFKVACHTRSGSNGWLTHSLSMTIIKADGDDDIYLSRFKDLGRGCSTHSRKSLQKYDKLRGKSGIMIMIV